MVKVVQVSFVYVPGGEAGVKNYSIDSMCLGAVNNGIKFCMASAQDCSIGTHTKKVAVELNHVYVNAGKGAAFSDPHIPVSFMEEADLNSYLAELRPREAWLRIFQALIEDNSEETVLKPLVTPKKRKHRYLTEPTSSTLASIESWDQVDSTDNLKLLTDMMQQLDQRLTACLSATCW
jgi:hypothetical protein